MTASLTRLPNELLLLISTSCPSISTAARLSAASKPLHAIWLENLRSIVTEILYSKTPAYEDAVALAKYECGDDAPLPQWVPRLLRNVEMAQSVSVQWQAFLPKLGQEVQAQLSDSSSIPASYYFIRQLVNSYNDFDLQVHMHSLIISASPSETAIRNALCYFMCRGHLNYEETSRHGISKENHLWTEEEHEYGLGIQDEWSFAADVLMVMNVEKHEPGFSSPDLLCPWRFRAKCCGEDRRRGQ